MKQHKWERQFVAWGLLMLLLFTSCLGICKAEEKKGDLRKHEEVVEVVKDIKWLGHASFRIKDDKVIYIDPWKLKTPEPADIMKRLPRL